MNRKATMISMVMSCLTVGATACGLNPSNLQAFKRGGNDKSSSRASDIPGDNIYGRWRMTAEAMFDHVCTIGQVCSKSVESGDLERNILEFREDAVSTSLIGENFRVQGRNVEGQDILLTVTGRYELDGDHFTLKNMIPTAYLRSGVNAIDEADVVAWHSQWDNIFNSMHGKYQVSDDHLWFCPAQLMADADANGSSRHSETIDTNYCDFYERIDESREVMRGNLRGIRVQVSGASMGVDREFNNMVLTLLTKKIVEESTIDGQVHKWAGKVAKYIVTGRGDEGGQAFCIELDETASNDDVYDTWQAFDALGSKVPQDTVYSSEMVASCGEK